MNADHIPEQVIKLLKSPLNNDILIGLHLLVKYAKNEHDCHDLMTHFKVPHYMPKNENGNTINWKNYFLENKKYYEST